MSGDPVREARVDIADFEQVLNFFDESEEPNSVYLDSERLSQDFLRECEELIQANQGQTEQPDEKTKNQMTPSSINSSLHGDLDETPGTTNVQSITSSNNTSSSINDKCEPLSPSLSKAFQKMKLAQSPKKNQDVLGFRAERTEPKTSISSTEFNPSDGAGDTNDGDACEN
ncbi:hypothetical protein FGB62_292g010 [Gracilaria domingensis]|nr:hypothetical protein FGB62_292g010 [Gracilaria domingensis]